MRRGAPSGWSGLGRTNARVDRTARSLWTIGRLDTGTALGIFDSNTPV